MKKELKADSEIKSLEIGPIVSFAVIVKMKQVIKKEFNNGFGHTEFEFYVTGRTASWMSA